MTVLDSISSDQGPVQNLNPLHDIDIQMLWLLQKKSFVESLLIPQKTRQLPDAILELTHL